MQRTIPVEDVAHGKMRYELVLSQGQGNGWDARKGKDAGRSEPNGDENSGSAARILNRSECPKEKSKGQILVGINARYVTQAP